MHEVTPNPHARPRKEASAHEWLRQYPGLGEGNRPVSPVKAVMAVH
jgi:hypothetical protein